MAKGARTNRSVRGILAVVGIVAALTIWVTVLSPRAQSRRYRAEMTRMLQSSDPEARKRAAWTIIERPDPTLEMLMVRGVMGDEPNPDVREAFVYALGKLENPRYSAAIESAIDQDPSGYVRATAWLAAARIDPRHFRTLAQADPRPQRPWDRIGIAQGWLYLGDVRAVNELLHWADAGDDSQRQIASRAMFKWLWPLLDAAGRWPVGATVREGQSWPSELIAEIRRRCETLDLQAIADDTSCHRAAAYRVRRNVGRLTRVRDGLASLLFVQ